MASSSQSATPSAGGWTYDVFLSFRGEDTRRNFVDHLHAALDQRGIYTFKDDKKLRRGETIAPELLKAIEESRCAVVVFSENYANSSWCLSELEKIMECQDRRGQKVLPVFYYVDPSDVRGQKGSFDTAFQQHEERFKKEMEKVKRWRKALAAAAGISGWHLNKTSNEGEADIIKMIVSNIWSHAKPHPKDKLIGMDSRVRDLKSLLGDFHDACLIGVWGMGGLGKTTLARTIFREISHEFDGSSFLEDVRENGSDKKGLKDLQKKLLSEILMDKSICLRDCDDGISQIQTRLRCKKVLLVLDDVDKLVQLECLAEIEWFGPGSKIIVTTRDKHILESYAQAIYAPQLLNKSEATRLFNKYAFKKNSPREGYEELLDKVVDSAGGLPLALKVLGSHLCGRELNVWRSALKALAKVPNDEQHPVLKLSFDGLNILQQNIFLDIACFFKGIERDYVTTLLDYCGFEPTFGIEVLIEKSLVTISKGCLEMHDLVQEMGQHIVRKSYVDSRLWMEDEISDVMASSTRLEVVEAIVDLDAQCNRHYFLPLDRWNPCFNAKVFSSMNKLRLLHIDTRFTESEPPHLPHELRLLKWRGYPFDYFSLSTATGGISKLVHLEMRNSKFKQLLTGPTMLPNLKIIDLSESDQLERFPDVTGVPNLEKLKLKDCKSLVEVHESVGCLERLVYWNMSHCIRLEILPSTIHMKSLQTLTLSCCQSLERFPEISAEMGNLTKLSLDGCCKLKELPSSIRFVTGLTSFHLGNCRKIQYSCNSIYDLQFGAAIRLTVCEKLDFPTETEGNTEDLLSRSYSGYDVSQHLTQASTCLTSLRTLDLHLSELLEEDFPCNVHKAWPLLEVLDLSYNYPLTRLPASICHISQLKVLKLHCCSNLEELGELPSGIQVLEAGCCFSLKSIGDLSNKYKWLYKISLYECDELLKNHEETQSHLDNMLRRSFVQKWAAMNHPMSVTVPGSKVPDWFNNRQWGNKITLELPPSWHTKITGFAICAVLSGSLFARDYYITVKFKMGDGEELIYKPYFDQNQSARKFGEHVWIGFISLDFFQKIYHDFQPGDNSLIEGKLVISPYKGSCDVLKCGGCIVFKEEVEHMNFGKLKNYEDASYVCIVKEDYKGFKTIEMKL